MKATGVFEKNRILEQTHVGVQRLIPKFVVPATVAELHSAQCVALSSVLASAHEIPKHVGLTTALLEQVRTLTLGCAAAASGSRS